MKAERWQQLKEGFDQALDLQPEDRESFLNQVCGDDSDLRQELASLLEADEKAGPFIAEPILQRPPEQDGAVVSEVEPTEALRQPEVILDQFRKWATANTPTTMT